MEPSDPLEYLTWRKALASPCECRGLADSKQQCRVLVAVAAYITASPSQQMHPGLDEHQHSSSSSGISSKQSMAGVQDLPLQLPRRDAPYYFVALVGASVVVFFVAGEPPVHPGYALAGFLLWLLGAARLLLLGQLGARAAAAANLARRAARCHHLFMLIGASAVVFSVVGEPPVDEWFALAGFLLWLLGVANLLFGRTLHALSPGVLANVAMEKLKYFISGRGDPASAPA
ncbi:hypothetical protein ACP70R_033972 [Stipagrostis hirtigluma subsp. patula]